jgi:hypothetical protein
MHHHCVLLPHHEASTQQAIGKKSSIKPRISINIRKIVPFCSDWEASMQQAIGKKIQLEAPTFNKHL